MGDHPPRHVHVYRDGRLILKFDLDAGIVLQGRHSAPIIALIRRLQREGRL